MTGNLLLLNGLVLAYDLFCLSKGNSFYDADNKNLSAKSERTFFEDKRFWIPLHAYNLLECMIWIWQLVLFSDYYQPKW